MGSEVDSRSMVGRKIVDLLIRVQFPSVHLWETIMDLFDETILLLKKLREQLFFKGIFSSNITEEEIDNKEIEKLLKIINRNVDKILDGLKSGKLTVDKTKYVNLIKAIINTNTEYHNDSGLTSENKICHQKLIASLKSMNDLIVIWNKIHNDHISTLDEIKRIINEELEKGWRFLEEDVKKYRGENELD